MIVVVAGAREFGEDYDEASCNGTLDQEKMRRAIQLVSVSRSHCIRIPHQLVAC